MQSQNGCSCFKPIWHQKASKLSINIPKFLGYIYKKWSYLQYTKCQNILIIYNLLFKRNSKDQSFKINYTALITFNLIDLFSKTRHGFKNESIKSHKGSLNTGIIRFNMINKLSFRRKVQSALPRGAASKITTFLANSLPQLHTPLPPIVIS